MEVVKFNFLLLFLLLLCIEAYAQNPTWRVTVESGGHADFKIYTLEKYENGLDYIDWTNLRMVYEDTTSGTQEDKWYLGVKAQDIEFISSFEERSLPLDLLSLEVSDGGGEDSFGGEIVSEEITLTDSYQPLVELGDEGNYKLNITYRLDSTLGRPPAYYNTNLIFKMDTTAPSGW